MWRQPIKQKEIKLKSSYIMIAKWYSIIYSNILKQTECNGHSYDEYMCEESCHTPSWSFCVIQMFTYKVGLTRSHFQEVDLCIVLNAACWTLPLACPVLTSSHCSRNLTPSLLSRTTSQNCSPPPQAALFCLSHSPTLGSHHDLLSFL